LESRAGKVFAVDWSPDGQILASASIVTTTNPSVQLWDPAGQVVKTLNTSFSGGKFYNLVWSPDGKYLLGGATDYKLWRADGEQVFWLQGCSHCTPSWAMAWSPDSRLWALGDEGGNVQIFTNTGENIAKVVDQSSVNSLAWSPDGTLLAGARTLWSPSGEYLHNLLDQASFVYVDAWSPDGKILATGGSDQTVHLWKAQGRDALAILKGFGDDVLALAWSPDGKILASGSADGSIRLWMIGR
jgi:WD40 repeat protein